MKFYSDRIVTRPISLEEAAAKAKGQKPVDLNQVLANIDSQNKQVKTAASEAPAKPAEAPKVVEAAKEAPKVVEAAKEEPKVVEAAKAEAPKVVEANAGNFGDKKAPPFGKKDEKGEGKEEKKEEKHKDGCDCKSCSGAMASTEKPAKKAATKMSLKVAKSLDFRGWSADDVVKSWGQHGSIEKCCSNVDGKVSDAKTYCGLLQVAASEAGKIVKEAAAAKQTKEANVDKQHKHARFKLIAKMTEDEISRMKKYWTEMYGAEYANSMLEDY